MYHYMKLDEHVKQRLHQTLAKLTNFIRCVKLCINWYNMHEAQQSL